MARVAARLVARVVVIAAVGVWPGFAHACPFCGVVGESLAMRRDVADVAIVGEAAGPATAGSDGFLTQSFRIDQVLRGTVPAGTEAVARVSGPVGGTALLFGSASAGRLGWSAVAADEALLGYVAAAPDVAAGGRAAALVRAVARAPGACDRGGRLRRVRPRTLRGGARGGRRVRRRQARQMGR